MKKSLLWILSIVLMLIFCGCNSFSAEREQDFYIPEKEPPSVSEPALPEDENEDPPEEVISEATLLAVGDNLIHDVIYYQAGKRADDGSYDFLPVYEDVRELISAADIAYINQETPMAGSMKPSSYPMFNTPAEMAENLSELGFDVINLANNHMLDKGTEGLSETAELLRKTEGISAVIGANFGSEGYGEPAVVEKNGIKFGFVGFTQHTNGLRLPKGRENMIVYTDNTEEMRRLIQKLKASADVAVVSVHWGDEGSNVPNTYQIELAQQFADWGVDIVIGTHPHVIQPVEYVQGENGGETLVFYSLGNFVSAQIEPANLIGAVAQITVTKNQTTGEINISAPKLDFVITQYGYGFADLHLVMLENYSGELAKQHGVVLKYGKEFGPEYIQNFIEETVDSRFFVSGTKIKSRFAG
ncbi:MAG: CapA family protein [Ruminococcaceae bacterium]|nr:CapA family protein [Oscillospiraceae bacterium]